MSDIALNWYGRPYKTHKWTAAELGIVRKMYPDNCCDDIANVINAKTKHPVLVTAAGILYQAKKMGLLKAQNFRKEHHRVTRGQFGRGRGHSTKHQPGVPYKLRKPDKDGYYWFVIDPTTGRRKPAHRYLMEQQHGPLGRNRLIIFAGGDKSKLEGLTVIERGSKQHMAPARHKTDQPEARRAAWETRRRNMAAKAYRSHTPYQFR